MLYDRHYNTIIKKIQINREKSVIINTESEIKFSSFLSEKISFDKKLHSYTKYSINDRKIIIRSH